MNYLVTYEDAMKMVEAYKNFNFSKSEYMMDGYKLVTFGYFLCDYNHFVRPLRERPRVNALDMRGVTFVFNKDGSLYKRFFMLRKFFNLNQVESTKLPNGKVFAKTIGSFDNDQTNAAMKIYNEDEQIQTVVDHHLHFGETPLFEYVSWDNRIVLKYSKPELRFLGCRDNQTGEFFGAYNYKDDFPVKKAATVSGVTLDELIEKSKTEEDKEGWVVEFEDGQFIKLKTDWYFNLHGIRTMNVFREDWVIKNYLEETLDDVVGQLDEKEDVDALKFVDRVVNAVDNYLVAVEKGVARLKKIYEDEYKSNWHYYAKHNNKEPFFGLSVTAIQYPDKYNDKLTEYVINMNKHLKKAQKFVDKWSTIKDDIESPWRK